MLTRDEHLHFSQHGWILLEGVFDAAQCAVYIEGLKKLSRTRRAVEPSHDADLTVIDNMVFHDPLFLEWLRTPRVLAANRQLLGAQPRFQGVNAHIKTPHPERHSRGEELYDFDTMGWHRGLRPKWGNFAHDTDSALINCAFLNNVSYLTDVSPRNGGTLMLDGSHLIEGDYATLKDKCEVVEASAKAGDVLLFTETLMHAGAPILSETTRYNIYYGFTPPWFCSWPGMEVPQAVVDSLADENLRELIGAHGYIGQSE